MNSLGYETSDPDILKVDDGGDGLWSTFSLMKDQKTSVSVKILTDTEFELDNKEAFLKNVEANTVVFSYGYEYWFYKKEMPEQDFAKAIFQKHNIITNALDDLAAFRNKHTLESEIEEALSNAISNLSDGLRDVKFREKVVSLFAQAAEADKSEKYLVALREKVEPLKGAERALASYLLALVYMSLGEYNLALDSFSGLEKEIPNEDKYKLYHNIGNCHAYQNHHRKSDQ